MSNFGIYRTRLPFENKKLIERLDNQEKIYFYSQIIEQSNESKEIYDEYNINYPDKFIGISLMGKLLTEENFRKSLAEILSEKKLNPSEEIHIEYMCHPGQIPKDFYWDDFNCSQDRIHEKETMEMIFSNLNSARDNIYNFELKNYYDLPSKTNIDKYNILIIGNLTYGTGNYITALRLRKFMKDLNYNSYLYNIKNINQAENEKIQYQLMKKLELFIIKNKIHLIIGIHILRSGSVLSLLNKNKDFLLKIPYCLITAGTDANEFINKPDTRELMKISIDNSEKIISFNEEMIIKLEEQIGEIKNKIIIPQSMMIDTSSLFSIRKKLNIPMNYKVTLFPAGFRKIKDIKFILNELIDLMSEYKDHVVILMGVILEIDYYDEILALLLLRKNSRIIIEKIVEHEDFMNIIKESDLVLNSSISEGMSNALLESMKIGVPVLARDNEGNRKLIQNNLNGFLFKTPEEFKSLYRKIYNHEEIRKSLIMNAKKNVNKHFDTDAEMEKYKFVIEEIMKKKYYPYKRFKLYFPEKVHPFSEENNELFESIKYNGNSENINILDMGCGSGIFSFIFLLKNKSIIVNELVLVDIEENCLFSSYQNLIYYKNYFSIKKLTIIKSDLFSSIGKKFENYFDIILANMPQTPSLNKMRGMLI